MCYISVISRKQTNVLGEVKILSLIILLQYLFACLKIPGPSIFWPMNIIKPFCSIFPKCLRVDITRVLNVTAFQPFPKKSLLSYYIECVDQRHATVLLIHVINGLYRNSIPTCRRTKYISVPETNQLLLFRKRNTVHCQNRMKYINTLCWQNAEM
jgi:hypothetical protein